MEDFNSLEFATDQVGQNLKKEIDLTNVISIVDLIDKQFHLSTGYVINKLKQKCHKRTKTNTYLLRGNNGHPRLFKAYHFIH